MNRIVGIILVVVGIISGAYALTRHDEEKTLLEIGDVEIKNDNKKPGQNTTIYYVIAAIGIIGGGAMLASKNRK
ncbi:MAG TPA: hypothetical protein PLO67_06105 [Saprospiraceae bacterium]|nr:hypothetical protein [Saprospiraceae bacterium]HPI05727.1 hypothetical protein [Saprospiraceae bacterium]